MGRWAETAKDAAAILPICPSAFTRMTDMSDEQYRTEKDSLGEMKVPATALWGASTQRAVENFPISNMRFSREFIYALALIKKSAAETHVDLELLPKDIGEAIVGAAEEVMRGDLDEHFPLDIFQTGSGTSTNTNANEVIAHRATQLTKGAVKVHPNDHVNAGQSSNDVIPSAMQIAALVSIHSDLLPALTDLERALKAKAEEFDGIVKSGRTHMMDATPVRLGQEFGGFASQVAHSIVRVEEASRDLGELPLGGTAVGTGINTHAEFARRTIKKISRATERDFREAPNHFERQGTRDVIVYVHGALNALAVSLTKIANDMRLLASGPRAAIAEITLPAVQPGSSIMPGKVNPVMAEAMTMVAAQVMGNHTTITVGGLGSYLELNVMMPIMAHALLQSVRLLSRVTEVFTTRCVAGTVANEDRCRELLEKNPSLATALVPRIGYDAAAALAKEAFATGSTVRELARKKGILPDEELDELLDPRAMTEPGIPGGLLMGGGG
jgi:fumarate hydratase class II